MEISLFDSFWSFLKMPFIWVGFGSAFLLWLVPKVFVLCQNAFKRG